jgi:hypothetical protein
MDVKFEVLVNDRAIPERQRESRKYILVQKGQEYKLRVSNYKSRRVLAVISVDGLSIMNGQPGDILSSAGYIIDPNQSIDIPGWRLNNDEVAKFYFSSIDESYTHLIDKPTNIGVIGCAFFAEKEKITPSGIVISGEGKFGWRGGVEKQTVGTGFGQVQNHHVTEIEFERETKPFYVHIIYYLEDSHSASQPTYKNPFPGCQPPQSWHR